MLCQDFVYEQRLDGVINETRQDLEIPRGMGESQIISSYIDFAAFADLLSTSHSFDTPQNPRGSGRGSLLSCPTLRRLLSSLALDLLSLVEVRPSSPLSSPPQTALTSISRFSQQQGIRGILNLGQTCFLSVVLQTFLHNPLLRNHFLADRHNRYICAETSAASDSKKDCMCCEMDRMFADVSFPRDADSPLLRPVDLEPRLTPFLLSLSFFFSSTRRIGVHGDL